MLYMKKSDIDFQILQQTQHQMTLPIISCGKTERNSSKFQLIKMFSSAINTQIF